MKFSSDRKINYKALFSTTTYSLLNVAMVIAAWVAVVAINSPLLALFIILLGKWRVFAVKRRYWTANIQSNMVDYIVGFSYVVIMSNVGVENVFSQTLLAILYTAWLLFIKPQSSIKFIKIQALVGMFTGLSALSAVSYDWAPLTSLALVAMIAYFSFKHATAHVDGMNHTFFGLMWALMLSELAWILLNWTTAYSVRVGVFLALGDFKVSQLAIISTILSGVAWTVIDKEIGNLREDAKSFFFDNKLPIIFSIIMTLGLIFLFSQATIGL